jgi:hypothetical protein
VTGFLSPAVAVTVIMAENQVKVYWSGHYWWWTIQVEGGGAKRPGKIDTILPNE